MTGPLKLRACDGADLGIIAALLQDALVSVSEVTYLPTEKRFVMVLNRFRWETADPTAPGAPTDAEKEPVPPARDAPFEEDESEPKPHFERIHCALRFDRVAAVRTRGIDLRARGRILELLTIQLENGVVLLLFAEDAAIRLEVEALQCYLEDLGEAWPTRWRPQHRLEEDVE